MATTPRRRRWDATRNHDQLLESAAGAFAERGLSVDVREIAREAGVGVGTLYRHFPTKDDLLRAVLEPDLAEWADFTAEANGTEDAWQGLCLFVERTLELMAKRRAMLDGLSGAASDSAAFEACHAHLRDALEGLVTRAHRQGTLRRDVSAGDLGLQILALGRIVQLTAAEDPGRWRRHLGFVLDGLRARRGDGTRQHPTR
ncbi:TetR/AcrR family transcriptional regulator [Amycolatopsis anabasis]|uniref:TetR/AcrR family transcriptional regulator n=1 Tax=Amycolatopsis anabasis TaxID=1840409 RepID=UPI00131DD4EA|nr:TetR/AcrR family transcriptional regulator [Amycolatopsis anabasis]